jgi:hypothetical protein
LCDRCRLLGRSASRCAAHIRAHYAVLLLLLFFSLNRDDAGSRAANDDERDHFTGIIFFGSIRGVASSQSRSQHHEGVAIGGRSSSRIQ